MTVHAVTTATTRRVHCRGCGRQATTPNPPNGHPYGWYTLSVNTPLIEAAELTADLYENE